MLSPALEEEKNKYLPQQTVVGGRPNIHDSSKKAYRADLPSGHDGLSWHITERNPLYNCIEGDRFST